MAAPEAKLSTAAGVLAKWPEVLLANRRKVVVASCVAIALIAVLDWQVQPNVSLGFLYIFPILLAAGLLQRAEIVLLAVVCAVLRETFGPTSWEPGFVMRESIVASVFLGAGLFANEMLRNRQRDIEHGRALAREVDLRREAEQQLRVLIESNPAAIVTVDSDGRILLANGALRRMLAGGDAVEGDSISNYVPALARVPHAHGTGSEFQTTMECTAHTRDGKVFLAHAWFSTYGTDSGPRLAAIILDSSEHLRDREGLGLLSLMTSSRVLVSAMLHEIRNLCAAAAVAHANLERIPDLEQNKDFGALGTLVKGLESLASSELRVASERNGASANLLTVLDELRIVIEPSFSEADASIRWDIRRSARPVYCDHHSLLQVFLNLSQNSLEAMQGRRVKELTISEEDQGSSVVVRFRDTGRGVPHPEQLFQVFQPGATGSGLGLYVSRAILRNYAGELAFEPQVEGSCFAVRVAVRNAHGGDGE